MCLFVRVVEEEADEIHGTVTRNGERHGQFRVYIYMRTLYHVDQETCTLVAEEDTADVDDTKNLDIAYAARR